MEQKVITVLRICAWIDLVLAIPFGFNEIVGPRGVGAGIIFAAWGLTGWAFLLVVCLIAESLIQIRTNTAPPEKSRLFDKDAR